MAHTLCPELRSENLLVNDTGRDPGVTVSLWCEDGYELAGSSVLTCTTERLWSDLTPVCLAQSSGSSQVVVIVVGVAAASVALGVLLGALYMVCTSLRKEHKAKAQEREFIEHLRELRIDTAVTQDCVGMPPVLHENLNATLRGRPTSEADSSSDGKRTQTPAEEAMATERAFIY